MTGKSTLYKAGGILYCLIIHYADVLGWRFQILFPIYEAGIMYVSGHDISVVQPTPDEILMQHPVQQAARSRFDLLTGHVVEQLLDLSRCIAGGNALAEREDMDLPAAVHKPCVSFSYSHRDDAAVRLPEACNIGIADHNGTGWIRNPR